MQSGRVSKDNDNTMQMTHAMTCAQHLELEPMTVKESVVKHRENVTCEYVLFTFFECFMMCVRLFQVVQLSCFSWFWRLFETMLSCFSSCVGLFRSSWVNQALQVVLGHFGSLCYSICFGSFTL